MHEFHMKARSEQSEHPKGLSLRNQLQGKTIAMCFNFQETCKLLWFHRQMYLVSFKFSGCWNSLSQIWRGFIALVIGRCNSRSFSRGPEQLAIKSTCDDLGIKLISYSPAWSRHAHREVWWKRGGSPSRSQRLTVPADFAWAATAPK